MEWYVGFTLGILVAIIGIAARGPVPASRRRKIQRRWWLSQKQWDEKRGFTEAEYKEWRKEMRKKEDEEERKRNNTKE
jgi:hypothetical protein